MQTSKPRIHRRFVTLAEVVGRGWLYREHGVYYRALANAVRLVARDNDAMVKQGGADAVVTIITYVPCTDAGTALVRELTKEK